MIPWESRNDLPDRALGVKSRPLGSQDTVARAPMKMRLHASRLPQVLKIIEGGSLIPNERPARALRIHAMTPGLSF